MPTNTVKHFHFIGIGGIGISAIANIMLRQGHKISGSDLCNSEIIENLQNKGAEIHLEHKKENLNLSTDTVVYSPAIPKNNPELVSAREKNLQILSYPEALGKISQQYQTIAIAGTHGKSTTTGMISKIFLDAGMDPTIIIGTKLQELKNQNFHLGKSKILIVEACEYKKSFEFLYPETLVITNIEPDHLDYYQTSENYFKAFEAIAEKLPKKGKIFYNANDSNSKRILKNFFKAEKIKKDSNLKLNLAGEFNKENASLALAVGRHYSIKENSILQSLKNYQGSWRRMEEKQKVQGVRVIDDYGHHPTEIKVTLKALKERYKAKKILCVFQPHQYNRTWHFLKEFGRSFTNATKVIIPNIYQVRDSEKDLQKINTQMLVLEIQKNGIETANGENLQLTAKIIKKEAKKYDLIVIMGAGDIEKIFPYLY